MSNDNNNHRPEHEPIFGTTEAAAYIGVVPSVMRYHVYTSKNIKPDFRLGRELGFYKSTLDAYMKEYQSTDLTISEAAKYLGVTPDRIEYHYHVLDTIKPSGKRGKHVTFSRADLDAARPVITTRSPRGRTAKPKKSVNVAQESE